MNYIGAIKVKVENFCKHSFLESYISDNSCIVDCGANHGDFSLQISRKWCCIIHGLEPDPRLFPNLPIIEKCTFHQLALSDKRGNMMLNLGQLQCSSLHYKEKENFCKIKVETISLPEFCGLNNIGKIDLLKLDIEGSEMLVFKKLEDEWIVKKLIQITVEFHEFLDPSVVPEIKAIIKRLKRLGFYYLPFSRTYGDVLFVNKSFINLSLIDKIRIFVTKYKRGISRILDSRSISTYNSSVCSKSLTVLK